MYSKRLSAYLDDIELPPRRTGQCKSALDSSPALDESNQHGSDRNHEKNMNETAERVGSDHPEEPQQEHHDKDCPEHCGLLSVLTWRQRRRLTGA
jgi:hypothetical protein